MTLRGSNPSPAKLMALPVMWVACSDLTEAPWGRVVQIKDVKTNKDVDEEEDEDEDDD